MKSEIYSVRLVFDANVNDLRQASKCDYPNGWLFFSHIISILLVIQRVGLQCLLTMIGPPLMCVLI